MIFSMGGFGFVKDPSFLKEKYRIREGLIDKTRNYERLKNTIIQSLGLKKITKTKKSNFIVNLS